MGDPLWMIDSQALGDEAAHHSAIVEPVPINITRGGPWPRSYQAILVPATRVV